MPAPTGFQKFPSRYGCESIDTLDVIFDVTICIMLEGIFEPAHFAADQDLFMGFTAAPSRLFSAKQADVIIGVPATAPPPATEIVDQARHRISSAGLGLCI